MMSSAEGAGGASDARRRRRRAAADAARLRANTRLVRILTHANADAYHAQHPLLGAAVGAHLAALRVDVGAVALGGDVPQPEEERLEDGGVVAVDETLNDDVVRVGGQPGAKLRGRGGDVARWRAAGDAGWVRTFSHVHSMR